MICSFFDFGTGFSNEIGDSRKLPFSCLAPRSDQLFLPLLLGANLCLNRGTNNLIGNTHL